MSKEPVFMKSRSSQEIRSQFLEFFEQHDHRVYSSYPLVPPNDPTLLFTNAGMVQFKDIFTGKEPRNHPRAASSQKCVRAGGKHNDLENVGFTARHHTFFEMLGNFSFGDYFKKDAIRFAWEFLVDWMQLPEDRLWVSVFEGDPSDGLPPDEEAADIWHSETGIAKDRILRFGKHDNFWSMGDTGPCGPCSEIHFDQGDRVACNQSGGCLGVACECDRFLEIWNLVFMQFERDDNGKLTALPAPSIDTGMGLERLCAVMQSSQWNYDTDLFLPLINQMGSLCSKPYGRDLGWDVSLRVVADHARATAFLISDGVLPSNEGRGYVLRRIMRRAIRHGHKLGVSALFFHEICLRVVELMAGVYPELEDRKTLLEKAVRLEEETFRRTLENGLRILKREMSQQASLGARRLPGKLVFDLQTRDGFPPDLTAVIAKEQGFSIDHTSYQKEWEHHQQVSSSGLGMQETDRIYHAVLNQAGGSAFSGYETTEGTGKVLALIQLAPDNTDQAHKIQATRNLLEHASKGERIEAVISPTPFYGESGGQIGDTGLISSDTFKGVIENTLKPLSDLTVHRIHVIDGSISIGDTVRLTVDPERRTSVRLNHSATHLLQAALRKILGTHVNQKGSLVAPDRLRFDFSHFAAMTREEIAATEQLVNQLIRRNYSINTTQTDLDGARNAGATMLFGEKYEQQVRMVQMGDVSLELCGGTHAERTGDIGVFKIISESSVQAGVRRIEALTGSDALERFQQFEHQLMQAASVLKSSPDDLNERLNNMIVRERELVRKIEKLKQAAACGPTSNPLENSKEIKGIKALFLNTQGIELSGLRDFTDNLKDRMGGGVVMTTANAGNKISLVCSVSKQFTDRLQAGQLLKEVLLVTGGKGGGRADFAQGGGGDPQLTDQAEKEFYRLVLEKLSA